MKRLLLLISMACLSHLAFAGAVACINNDTLVDYIALGSTGCTLGPVLLTNFSFTTTVVTAFPPGPVGDNFIVNVIPSGSGVFEGGPDIGIGLNPPGYVITANTTAQQSILTTISYDASVISPDSTILYYGMAANAFSDGPHASASATSQTPCFLNGNGINFCSVKGPTAHITNVIRLQTDLVTPNATFDRASFSGIDSGFIMGLAIPEPSTFALAGVLLVSLAIARLPLSSAGKGV